MIGREDEVRGYRARATRYGYAVLFFFALLGTRLFYLQILKGEELRQFSESNRLKKEKLFPTRGRIYDRNGKVIVDSRASFDVVVLKQFYDFLPETNVRLAQALQMPLDELEKRLEKAKRNPPFIPILLKADVSKDIIAELEMDTEGFPGVDIEANVIRRYPYGDLGAQILGYVGEVNDREIASLRKVDGSVGPGDYVGKTGLEKRYDPYLRGQTGTGYVEVDSRGRRRSTERGARLLGFAAREEPVPGHNMYLTLDMDLQETAAAAMKAGDYKGSLVAIDPRTGYVLAMVNSPSYDPAAISGREVNAATWKAIREDELRPLRNRAIQDIYPPGSTFKPLMAIAGLAEGILTSQSDVMCKGHIQFGRRKVNCWTTHGHIDLIGSIRESCDVFYYKVGAQLGPDKMAKYARLFGLGAKTEINLDDESAGLIPDSKWKEERFGEPWQPGESLSVAIGQGYVTATPLQMANAYAALGNGGFLYRPRIVSKIESRRGETILEFPPKLIRKIEVPGEVFDIVKEGLWQVVNARGGTAFWSRSKKVQTSGKTGTSQVRSFKDIKAFHCEDLPFLERHHGSFVGFAPKENPQIAVAMVGEHICKSSKAAKVATELIDKYFENLEKEQELLNGTRGIAADGEPETKPAPAEPPAPKPKSKPMAKPVSVPSAESASDGIADSGEEEIH